MLNDVGIIYCDCVRKVSSRRHSDSRPHVCFSMFQPISLCYIGLPMGLDMFLLTPGVFAGELRGVQASHGQMEHLIGHWKNLCPSNPKTGIQKLHTVYGTG